MAKNKATVVYNGLVSDGAAIETAIELIDYAASESFVVIPQADGLSCIIIQVETA